MIRVLYILPSINKANGVNKFVYNYLSKINNKNFHFEILTQESRSIDFAKKYEDIGVKVHTLPSFKKHSFFKNINNIKSFFKANDSYDIVHCNVVNYGAFYLRAAKKNGSNIRILHSHATKSSDKIISKIRNFFLEPVAKYYANEYAACSVLAAKHLFRNKKFKLIYNAMDVTAIQNKLYSCDINTNFLTLSKGKKVIGFVGRLVKQKNPLFIVEIAYKLKLIYKNFIILIIGTGILEEKMKEEIVKANMNEHFFFLGEIEDAKPYYNYMDCFILPSIFEGLPLVAIEAQLSGLPCLISAKVTNEVKISHTCKLINIDSAEIWATEIVNSFNEHKILPYAQEYDIHYAKEDLINYYKLLLKKYNNSVLERSEKNEKQ